MPKARRSGAPQSQQIADRFHLVLNLSATMEHVLEERSRKLILPPVNDAAAEAQLAAPVKRVTSARTGNVSKSGPRRPLSSEMIVLYRDSQIPSMRDADAVSLTANSSGVARKLAEVA